MTTTAPLMKAIFNHVVLPPQLPGKHDDQLGQVEPALIRLLQNASSILRDLTEGGIRDHFDLVCHTLHTCRRVNAGGGLDRGTLRAEFGNLGRTGLLILHIVEQNAGLLIRRHQG